MPRSARDEGVHAEDIRWVPQTEVVGLITRNPGRKAFLECKMKYRGVEQLVARRAHNPEVVGSSPASATIKTPDFEGNPVFF